MNDLNQDIYFKNLKNKTWNVFRPEVDLYPMFINHYSSIIPQNIFEIGSHNGNDSEYLRSCYNIPHQNVFCFEPNPNTFQELSILHPNFNNIPVGISNYNGKTDFNCVKSDPGVSSIRKKIHLQPNDGDSSLVDIVRMDYIIEHYNIQSIDLCKIDVEGCAYEVLEGFGNKLHIAKSFQIEAELTPLFENQKLFHHISEFLYSKGYYMAAFFGLGPVCDTIWIKNDLFKF